MSVLALVFMAMTMSAVTLPGSLQQGGGPVQAAIFADVSAIAPGRPFHVGVLFRMQPGWHIYWKNPGEAGMATRVALALPDGFLAGPLRWPRPVTFKQPGDVVGYGYEGEVLFAAQVTVPAGAPVGGRVALRADVAWLACREVCVPGQAALALELPVKAEAEPANGELFARWLERMPPLAPDFVLKDTEGRQVSLRRCRGRVVVLEWFNPDCPSVKRHHEGRSTMSSLAAKYAPRGVVWLAISSARGADARALEQWRRQWKLSYPVLLDADGRVARAYGARATPHMFVIGPDGEVAYEGAIDNDPYGASAGPVNYVDKALEELLSGRPVSEPRTSPYGCPIEHESG